jgi:arsenate reductase
MHVVLFVCVENTFRSVMAEAIFNARAPLGWMAESAGVQPAAAINPVVITLLREIGIELGPKEPRLVTPDMIEKAWWVITFGCLDRCPPRTKGKSEDWPMPGSTGKTDAELKMIRNDITRHIERLIEEIEGSRP